MQTRSRIRTTGPNNGHQLWDNSKSYNRSENRPLIFKKNRKRDILHKNIAVEYDILHRSISSERDILHK